MVDGLVGVFVLVGVTSFMALLVELGSFVLSPPASQESIEQLLDSQEYQSMLANFSSKSGLPLEKVKQGVIQQLCDLPRDAIASSNSGCTQ